MTALLGFVVMGLAFIGAVRVLRATWLASRRALASIGRAMARLEPQSAPTAKPEAPETHRDSIAAIASIAAARAKRAAKGAAK